MFSLTAEQLTKLTKWEEGLVRDYEGAIGGALTYTFTPTSLGVITKVYYLRGTDEECHIDLSDYEEW